MTYTPTHSDLKSHSTEGVAEAGAETRRILAGLTAAAVKGKSVPADTAAPSDLGEFAALELPAAAAAEERDSLERIGTAIDSPPDASDLQATIDCGTWRWAAVDADPNVDLAAIHDNGGRMRFVSASIMDATWRGMSDPERPRHPLVPRLLAWVNRPISVKPDRRKDSRILAVVETRPERRRGQLFGGLTDGRQPDTTQLPLWPEGPRLRVPLIELMDATGVPVRNRGRGAPLARRLFVQSALAVPVANRSLPSVRFALTIEELLDGLWPRNPTTGKRGWRPGKHWPELRHALMDAHNHTIVLPDGGRWFMLALRRLPHEDPETGLPRLDDVVVLDVALPPGARTGPVVDLPFLSRVGVESGPRYNAYIAAKSLAWLPGKTRRPVPKAGGRWGDSKNEADYPVISAADRRRLAFGARDNKNRTRDQVDKPWRDLPGLRTVENMIDPHTGIVGFRLIPDKEEA